LFMVAFYTVAVGQASAADKLVIGLVPGVANAVIYVAQERGVFAKNGLDVSFINGNGSVLVSGVVSGSMTLAGPTVPTLLQGIDNGLELSVVSGLNTISREHLEYSVVVGTKAKIEKAADFSGKTIGINTIGALLHVLFQSWLSNNGVNPSTVRFVEVPFPQMADVLRQGTVDAVVAVQPFIDRIVASKVGTNGPDFVKSLPDGLPIIAIAGSNKWVAANKDIVGRFRQSLKEAEALILQDETKAKADVNVFLKMPPEVVAQVPLPAVALDVDPAKLQVFIDTMTSMSLLQNDIKPAAIIAK
jgi:NitT/TauT family transport system substrate-binding protein